MPPSGMSCETASHVGHVAILIAGERTATCSFHLRFCFNAESLYSAVQYNTVAGKHENKDALYCIY